MQKCSCNSDSLLLTAGQRVTQFSDFCVVSFWKSHNKIMIDAFFAASIISSLDAPALPPRYCLQSNHEQVCFLRDITFHIS